MVAHTRQYTAEEFDQLVELPENAARRLEYIGGEIVEVVSNNYSSVIASTINFFIQLYLREKEIAGYVTGADGGYIVSGERYIPDMAFISSARQPEPSRAAYNPNPPDLAVEVLSPGNDPGVIRFKIYNYLKAGTVVWVVDPEKKLVEVYAADDAKKIGIDGALDGGAVLPGFTLAVKDIFPDA